MKPTVWRDAIRDSGLDGTAKHVAHVISTYMNGAGDTFVGKETIAKGASLKSVRAVDTAINRLEAAELIEIRRSRGGRPNHYLARTPHHAAGSTPHEDAGFDPASDDTEPRTKVRSTPHGGAPESGLKRLESVTPQPPAQRGARKITQKELRRYTGWRFVRGSHGSTYVEDPLGTDKPPLGWPDRRPTTEQVMAALERVSA